jgi:hypothetical protein
MAVDHQEETFGSAAVERISEKDCGTRGLVCRINAIL